MSNLTSSSIYTLEQGLCEMGSHKKGGDRLTIIMWYEKCCTHKILWGYSDT